MLLAAGGVAAEPTLPLQNITHQYNLHEAPGEPLALPSDLVAAPDGRLYVVDSGNHRVVVYGSEGKPLSTFGKRGHGEGEFSDPVGIASDASGTIYVADSGNNRIQIFDHDGGYRSQFAVVEEGKAVRPVDIAVTGDGKRLYVTGNSNHKVMTFDHNGKLLHAWGGEGEDEGRFRFPATLAINVDHLYVVDVLNTRVQIFNFEGKLRFVVGEWGVLPGQLFRPKGVVVTDNGSVLVSDSYMGVIQVFDDHSKLMFVLGRGGAIERFTTPVGIDLDRNGRLYVAEMLANRVSVYSLQ